MPEHEPDEFARKLKTLQPSPAELDRDRLMFAAGRASLESRCRGWRLGTGIMTTASLGLAALLVAQPAPEAQVRVVEVEVARGVMVRPADSTVPAPQPSDTEGAEVPSWRLQKALAQVDREQPPGAGNEEAPTGRHVASVWEWRSVYAQHPAILAEGE